MPTNYIHEHGIKLLTEGYHLVPIKAGEKHPHTKGWPNIRATRSHIHTWAKSRYYGGLGVLAEFCTGVDVDVYDKDIVEKVYQWCRDNIGPSPYRVGNPPRVLIPYSPPSEGLHAQSSSKYQSPDGKLHQIEIKARGQQWVCYGEHPKTGSPYIWKNPDGTPTDLHTYPKDFLPALTQDKIEELFLFFDSIIPADWVRLSSGKSASTNGVRTQEEPLLNIKTPLNVRREAIETILDALHPDKPVSGKGWRTVGMALYHQFNGSQEGLDLFIDWSKKSCEFDLDEILQRWPSWGDSTYMGNPVTLATVVSMYKTLSQGEPDRQAEKKTEGFKIPSTLAEWEKRFALVELPDGTEVHDCGLPIHLAERKTFRAFKDHTAAHVYKSVSESGSVKFHPMADMWKKSPRTRHYKGYTYQPGKERFCNRDYALEDARTYVNTFYFPPHREDAEGDLTPFFDFIEHLFPEKSERDWIIKWVARIVQFPGTRSFVTPINITGTTGTGRGIFFEILRHLVGAHNTHDVSKDDLEGRFNGFLDKCLIAVVQEIKAATGDRKYQMWERMKSLLADTSANIQEKGSDSYTSKIYANFLLFSNNIDALPIQDIHERRIYAMRGAERPLPTDKIDEILNWKASPDNISYLFKYLKNIHVDASDFKRAPITETKKQLVRASVGIAGSDLRQWLDEEAPKVFTFEEASKALLLYSDDIADSGINREIFRRAVSDKGLHSARVMRGGKRVTVYYRPGAGP